MTERVKVRYIGLVRNTTGISEEEITIASGSRVGDLLALLQQKYGDNFRDSLFKSNGELRPMVRVFMGNQEQEQIKLNSLLGTGPQVFILLEVYPSEGG